MANHPATISTEEFLASEFLTLRLTQFQKLKIEVKKLVLEIVQYYLSVFYPLNDDAGALCFDIGKVKKSRDEPVMTQCYKAFLEFLPIKFRSGIQGKNLFRQPTEADLISARFYENDLEKIIASNVEMFTPNEAGLTQADKIRLYEIQLERELREAQAQAQEENQPSI